MPSRRAEPNPKKNKNKKIQNTKNKKKFLDVFICVWVS
jgi:hypothetical protein